MQYIPKSTTRWTPPSSVVAVTIEKETWPAKLPSAYTPSDMKVTEYFKKGTQPTEVSDRYAKFDNVTNIQSTKTTKGYKLTWDWKKPTVLDETYLSKYFSNSVYGNESAKYLQARLDYNENTLGGTGFTIYEKDSKGSIKEIAYTAEKEYLYVPTLKEDVTIIIKANYKNYRDNASEGTELLIKYDGTVFETDELEITLTKPTLEIDKGTYKEEKNAIKVTFGTKDITSKVTPTYQIKDTKYTTIKELEEAVNTLSETEKEITITYSVTYKDKTTTATKTIKILEKNTTE